MKSPQIDLLKRVQFHFLIRRSTRDSQTLCSEQRKKLIRLVEEKKVNVVLVVSRYQQVPFLNRLLILSVHWPPKKSSVTHILFVCLRNAKTNLMWKAAKSLFLLLKSVRRRRICKNKNSTKKLMRHFRSMRTRYRKLIHILRMFVRGSTLLRNVFMYTYSQLSSRVLFNDAIDFFRTRYKFSLKSDIKVKIRRCFFSS